MTIGTGAAGLLKRSQQLILCLAAIPLILALLSYYTSARHAQSVTATLTTSQFLLSLDELLKTVQEAETGQRGYLLTGSSIYLTPFIRAKAEVGRNLELAKTWGARAGAPSADWELLGKTVRDKMSELQLTVDLKRSGKMDQALAVVGTNRGQQDMARLRRIIGNMKLQQTTRFEQRYRQQQASERNLTIAVVSGVILALLVLLISFRLTTLYALERDQAEAEMRYVNRELEARVAERTAALEARTRELEARAAELQRSNADLEQFASIASHDLQEPLRMVASYMAMLKKRYGHSFDETAETYIQFAISGASRMQALISDLLAYSRAGTQKLNKKEVPFHQIVKRAIGNLAVSIQESGARLSFGEMPVMEADEIKMTQVLQNLIGNALKFRKPDVAPIVDISVQRQDSEWLFTVSDNGIGFDRKYCDRIFEVFQRLHGVGSYPGNGIGLAICRRIVEHHGGRLWGEAEPGVGASFFFTLPDPKGVADSFGFQKDMRS